MDKKVKTLVFTSILAGLVVVLQLIGGIPLGPFSITLTLFPIVVGAVVLGPVPGLALGLVFGVIVSILSLTGKDPGGQMVFAANPFMGWVMCLAKGALAGFLPAIVYRGAVKFKYTPEITYGLTGAFLFIAGFSVAKLINGLSTGLQISVAVSFTLVAGLLLFGLYKLMKSGIASYYLASIVAPVANTGVFVLMMSIFFRSLLKSWAGDSDVFFYVLTGLCGINFLIELFVAIVLSPALASIASFAKRRL